MANTACMNRTRFGSRFSSDVQPGGSASYLYFNWKGKIQSVELAIYEKCSRNEFFQPILMNLKWNKTEDYIILPHPSFFILPHPSSSFLILPHPSSSFIIILHHHPSSSSFIIILVHHPCSSSLFIILIHHPSSSFSISHFFINQSVIYKGEGLVIGFTLMEIRTAITAFIILSNRLYNIQC